MSRRLIPFVALVAFAFGLGLTGCKSGEEKACANMLKIMKEDFEKNADDLPDEMKKKIEEEFQEDKFTETCVAELKKEKDDCKDYDKALSCIADAKSPDDFDKCEEHCKK